MNLLRLRAVARILILFIAGGVLFATAITAQTQVVARGGDPSPDASGELDGLGAPVIRPFGEVIFTSSIRENGFLVGGGIFRAGLEPGSLEILVAEGQPSPDGNGNFGPLNDVPYLNKSGEIAFDHFLENTLGNLTDATAVFVGRGGDEPLSIVARADQAIPGSGGDRFGLTLLPFALNNAGQVAFSNLTMVNEVLSIYRGDGTPASLTRIVGEGDPNPSGDGILGGGTPLPYLAVMNDIGQVAFHDATLVDGDFLVGIYRGASFASLVKIARQGDPTPSGNGTYRLFWDLFLPGFLSINATGQVAFGAVLENTSGGQADNFALFRGTGASTTELVRKGDPVPDGNGIFLDFFSRTQYILNNRGEVFFGSSVSGASGGATEGLFLARNSGIDQIARLGETAPGGGVFSSFTTLNALNHAGQVVFLALVDAGGFGSEEGLFLYENGSLFAVAREGDTIPGAGTLTTIVGGGLQGETGPSTACSMTLAKSPIASFPPAGVAKASPSTPRSPSSSPMDSSPVIWRAGRAPSSSLPRGCARESLPARPAIHGLEAPLTVIFGSVPSRSSIRVNRSVGYGRGPLGS